MAALTDQEIQDAIYEVYLRAAYPISDTSNISGFKVGNRACQYFINGMPAMCQHWSTTEHRCTFKDAIDDEGNVRKDDNGRVITPSYYGFTGYCDGLGRAYKCTQYASVKNDEGGNQDDGFICIAPNFFMSGVGKRQVIDGVEIKTPVTASGIVGYNEIDGVGRCDGKGWGTGECGYNGDPADCRAICNYYRPWKMGFGHLEPQSVESVLRREPPPQAFERRLPYNFKVYNLRSKMQKCLYWEDSPGQFYIEDDKIKLDKDAETTCTNQDDRARAYLTSLSTTSGTAPNWMLNDVWTDENKCIICNGAKPECPFYSGEWRYNTDEKMYDGAQITAEQILELRYWMRDWSSQQEYEDAFSDIRPNKQDPSSASIFTWEKWEKISNIVSDSIGLGKEVWLDIGEEEEGAIKRSEDIAGDKIIFVGSSEKDAEIYLINLTGAGYIPSILLDTPKLSTILSAPLNIEYPQRSITETRSFKEEYIQRRAAKYGKPAQEIGTRVSQEDQPLQVSFPSLIRDIANIYEADDRTRKLFGIEMIYFIKWLQEHKEKYITSTTAADDGYFNVGPVDLIYQRYNDMLVLVRTVDNNWNFYNINVWSQWYGGTIEQTTFSVDFEDGEDAVQTDSLPEYFSGEVSAGARINPISGYNPEGCRTEVNGAIPVYSKTSVHGETFLPIYFYGYSLKKITQSKAVQDNWSRIGTTKKILLEVDDLEVNHLYEWDIIEANMIPLNEEGSELKGDNVKEQIEMEVVFPTSFSSGNGIIKPKTNQRYIKPNMVVLQPKDEELKFGFNNEDWKLEVSYYYTKLKNDDTEFEDYEEVQWPSFDGNVNFFANSNLNVSVSDNSLDVDNISRGNVAVLINFSDEEGRVVSPIVTKLCTLVSKLFCRSVDILYGYSSPSKGYKLTPDGGLAVEIGPDQLLDDWSDLSVHSFKPPCGDHEMANADYGYEWFPFNGCTTTTYYTEYTGSNFCLNHYDEGGEVERDDYRFCGPIKYDPWVGSVGNWAADCKPRWKYRYSVCQDMPDGCAFTGKAYIRGPVDLSLYRNADPPWTPPPFGNLGRDMVRKYISDEHMGHVTYENLAKPAVKQQWMPFVIDNNTFFYSFNSFEEAYGRDCFNYFSQLNVLLNNEIEEEVDESNRYRWEDVFGLRTLIYVSYPDPLITYGDSLFGGTLKAVFYYFKENDIVWAWPETYRDIERGTETKFGETAVFGNRLTFVDIEKPEYLWGYDKKENRFICDEGEHTIIFTPPEVEEREDGGVDILTHAHISLDGNNERYFNVFYSDYSSTDYVDWVEDGEDESGGKENIYYKINDEDPDEWYLVDNMIYDGNALDDPDAAKATGREYTDPTDADAETIYAYNRGVIANIAKNKLQYLPFSEEIFEADEGIYSPLPIEYRFVAGSTWSGTDATLTIEMLQTPACITRMEVTGGWGEFVDGSLFCRPGFIVSRAGDVISEYEYASDFPSADGQDYVQYELSIPLNVNPDRMLKPSEKTKQLIVQIYGSTEQLMNIKEITFYKGEYVEWEESIKTWERKFIVSRGSDFGDWNINGPDKILNFHPDRENSGVYIPVGANTSYENSFEAQDKIRGSYARRQYYSDTSLAVNMNNLMDIETEKQRELYEAAREISDNPNTMTYSITVPPVYERFFDSYSIQYNSYGSATLNGAIPEWGKHYLVKQYKEGDFWQPQGHKFEWSENYRTQKCRVGQYGSFIGATGPLYNVYDAKFVHMDTYQQAYVANPLYALYANRIEFQLRAADLIAGTGSEAEKDPTGVLSTPITPNYGVE